MLGFPYGTTQTFRYNNASDLTLTLLAAEFRPGNDEDSDIRTIGYARRPDEEYEFRTQRTNEGASYWTAPRFQAYEFEWRLQRLSLQKAEVLIALFERQQRERLPIRLHDQRLASRQVSPRTRARVGTVAGAPTISGMVYFWGQYDIELLLQPENVVLAGGDCKTGAKYYNASFSAREMDFVPVSEDIA
ncbi:hypothetical protein GS597_01495 [Synechococcales cyanobacterium C]|uniref:Uncharacterized protein n=1 Tax=Petrachloros mirabilis ULC683 TaxID=2781853 RepID=A0A8K2A6B2_9CYAN|nr:hypothetical protein [Petrachloros mirabilis]NCJ05214.1 hypothetical protein [Petrachloros mirabilis ULC683]